MELLFPRTKAILQKAREYYGNSNQILVAVEELNELSCVLTKYPRYNTHDKAVEALREHVLEECGDVINVLDHVQVIFGITDDEIAESASRKGERLMRWLEKKGEMQTTTEDRDVPKVPCSKCIYNKEEHLELICSGCSANGFTSFIPKKD